MATTTDWLSTAGMVGVEPLLDRVLHEVCEGLGAAPEDYLEKVSQDEQARRELQQRITRLQEHPTLVQMRREAQLREAEQHLYLLRFLHTGMEPPDWVWDALGQEEEEQVREAAANAEEKDPQLLARVEHALEKLVSGMYGLCEDCGGPILLERLRLVPWAECCAPCQRKREGSPPEEEGPRIPVVHF
jgi:DnaK suppressor protein